MGFLSLLTHLFSVMVSIIISIAISFLDNFTLFEIARSFYFALYFSFFFFIIGVFILSKSYRNYITKFQHTDFIQLEQRDTLRFKYIFILGCFIILGSLFSIILHMNYVYTMNYKLKIPLFAVIGIAITFSIAVSMIDVINLLFALFNGEKVSEPPINHHRQIMPVIYLSCIMGFIFGGIFALFDIEDVRLSHISDMLAKEEGFLIPIAVIFGLIAGLFVSMKGKDDDDDKIIVEKGFKPIAQEEEI